MTYPTDKINRPVIGDTPNTPDGPHSPHDARVEEGRAGADDAIDAGAEVHAAAEVARIIGPRATPPIPPEIASYPGGKVGNLVKSLLHKDDARLGLAISRMLESYGPSKEARLPHVLPTTLRLFLESRLVLPQFRAQLADNLREALGEGPSNETTSRNLDLVVAYLVLHMANLRIQRIKETLSDDSRVLSILNTQIMPKVGPALGKKSDQVRRIYGDLLDNERVYKATLGRAVLDPEDIYLMAELRLDAGSTTRAGGFEGQSVKSVELTRTGKYYGVYEYFRDHILPRVGDRRFHVFNIAPGYMPRPSNLNRLLSRRSFFTSEPIEWVALGPNVHVTAADLSRRGIEAANERPQELLVIRLKQFVKAELYFRSLESLGRSRSTSGSDFSIIPVPDSVADRITARHMDIVLEPLGDDKADVVFCMDMENYLHTDLEYDLFFRINRAKMLNKVRAGGHLVLMKPPGDVYPMPTAEELTIFGYKPRPVVIDLPMPAQAYIYERERETKESGEIVASIERAQGRAREEVKAASDQVIEEGSPPTELELMATARWVNIKRWLPLTRWPYHFKRYKRYAEAATRLIDHRKSVGHEDPMQRPTVLVLGGAERWSDVFLADWAGRYRVILVDIDEHALSKAVEALPSELRRYVVPEVRDVTGGAMVRAVQRARRILREAKDLSELRHQYGGFLESLLTEELPMSDLLGGHEGVDLIVSDSILDFLVSSVLARFDEAVQSRYGLGMGIGEEIQAQIKGRWAKAHARAIAAAIKRSGVYAYLADGFFYSDCSGRVEGFSPIFARDDRRPYGGPFDLLDGEEGVKEAIHFSPWIWDPGYDQTMVERQAVVMAPSGMEHSSALAALTAEIDSIREDEAEELRKMRAASQVVPERGLGFFGDIPEGGKIVEAVNGFLKLNPEEAKKVLLKMSEGEELGYVVLALEYVSGKVDPVEYRDAVDRYKAILADFRAYYKERADFGWEAVYRYFQKKAGIVPNADERGTFARGLLGKQMRCLHLNGLAYLLGRAVGLKARGVEMVTEEELHFCLRVRMGREKIILDPYTALKVNYDQATVGFKDEVHREDQGVAEIWVSAEVSDLARTALFLGDRKRALGLVSLSMALCPAGLFNPYMRARNYGNILRERLFTGLPLELPSDIDDSIQKLETLLAQVSNPDVKSWGVYHHALGELYLLWEKDIEKAKGVLERAARLDAENAEILTALGECYLRDGKVEEGRTHFERARGVDSKGQVPYNLARIYLSLGDYGEAERYLKEWLSYMPEDFTGRRMMAWCLYHLGRLDEANGLCDQLLEVVQVSEDVQFLRERIQSGKSESVILPEIAVSPAEGLVWALLPDDFPERVEAVKFILNKIGESAEEDALILARKATILYVLTYACTDAEFMARLDPLPRAFMSESISPIALILESVTRQRTDSEVKALLGNREVLAAAINEYAGPRILVNLDGSIIMAVKFEDDSLARAAASASPENSLSSNNPYRLPAYDPEEPLKYPRSLPANDENKVAIAQVWRREMKVEILKAATERALRLSDEEVRREALKRLGFSENEFYYQLTYFYNNAAYNLLFAKSLRAFPRGTPIKAAIFGAGLLDMSNARGQWYQYALAAMVYYHTLPVQSLSPEVWELLLGVLFHFPNATLHVFDRDDRVIRDLTHSNRFTLWPDFTADGGPLADTNRSLHDLIMQNIGRDRMRVVGLPADHPVYTEIKEAPSERGHTARVFEVPKGQTEKLRPNQIDLGTDLLPDDASGLMIVYYLRTAYFMDPLLQRAAFIKIVDRLGMGGTLVTDYLLSEAEADLLGLKILGVDTGGAEVGAHADNPDRDRFVHSYVKVVNGNTPFVQEMMHVIRQVQVTRAHRMGLTDERSSDMDEGKLRERIEALFPREFPKRERLIEAIVVQLMRSGESEAAPFEVRFRAMIIMAALQLYVLTVKDFRAMLAENVQARLGEDLPFRPLFENMTAISQTLARRLIELADDDFRSLIGSGRSLADAVNKYIAPNLMDDGRLVLPDDAAASFEPPDMQDVKKPLGFLPYDYREQPYGFHRGLPHLGPPLTKGRKYSDRRTMRGNEGIEHGNEEIRQDDTQGRDDRHQRRHRTARWRHWAHVRTAMRSRGAARRALLK